MLCFALTIHLNYNRSCHPFVRHTFTDMLIQISTWRFIVVGYIPLHSTLGSLFILICIPFMLFRIFCIKTEFAKIIPGRRRLQGGLLGFTSRAWGALEMTPGLKRHQCEIEILGQNLGALPPNLSVEKTLLLEPCMDYSVDFDFAINCQIQMAQICHQIHHFYTTSWIATWQY